MAVSSFLLRLAKDGIPAVGRPSRITGPTLSPLVSLATSSARVRSGPDSPPAASLPWQNPHWAPNRASPSRACSAGYVCGVADFGRGSDAGLWVCERAGRAGEFG